MFKNSAQYYGLVSKLLHWSIAILIIGLIWLGWYMVQMGYYDPWYHDSLMAHKALGMLALLLGATKIVWSIYSTPPDFVPTIKPWERLAARSAHVLLFALMLSIPATGYLISTSAGDSISFFDWFDIPVMMQADERLRDLAIEWHYYLAYGAAGLVVIHALAALKHQFINKDGTLRKMLW